MHRQIVLASASPRRRELLGLLHAEFDIIPAKGEEVLTTTDPKCAVQELSAQKAEEIAVRMRSVRDSEKQENENSEYLIIGADTVVALEGEILGKPADEEMAFAMIKKLQGKSHSVFTGVTVIWNCPGQKELQRVMFAEETRVTVSSMTDAQIWNYVNRKESLDKAGAYAIQGAFGAFVERIEGDYNNVVGLPVSRLYRELYQKGIDLLKEA